MSIVNIAIIGGVVLLLIALVAMRRAKARAAEDLFEGFPEPMPLAAAAGQTAATTEFATAPGVEWAPPAGLDAWPGADEQPAEEPVAHDEPAAGEPAHEEPVADDVAAGEEPLEVGDEPVAAEIAVDDADADEGEAVAEAPEAPEAPEAGTGAYVWGEDELITEPGWPMPGDLDVAWASAPAAEAAAPAPAPAWESGVADPSAAGPELEWMAPPAAPAEDIPEWIPPADDAPAWTPPLEDLTGRTQVAEDPSGAPVWSMAADEDAPAADADAEPAPPAEIPAWEPPADLVGLGALDLAELSLDEVAAPAAAALPAFDLAPGPEAQDLLGPDPTPALEFDFMSGAAPEIDFAAAPVAESAEAVAAPAVAPAPAGDAARTGRFALGGFALQEGQQAYGGVSFRAELPEAPAAWSVAPDEGAAPGTIVLALEGTINCGPDGLEVVTEPGFAPTREGFTVRVAAGAPGPFAASGTFTVR